MRAVLTNLGSLGDVQSLLALAQELRRHDHEPIVALPPHYAAYVSRLGLGFRPVGDDLDYAALQRRDTAAMLRGAEPLALLRESLATLASMLDRMLDELMQYCRDADVLVSGHLQPAARAVHEQAGVPFVSVHTNHFGGMQPAPIREASCAVINPFRARHGLAPLRDPVHTDANSPQLALYAISRHLRHPSAGWPSHWHVVGPLFVDEPERCPDPALQRFLDSGAPPVVITFSSIAHEDPEAMTDLLLAAVEEAGCRAVILEGWSGLGRGRPSSDRVHFTGFVQHGWLLPRAACVVHAGGSGTTTAALRAGVPAIIVPHIDDQPMWAELVRGLGCAGRVIPYKELTALRLGAAIRHTLQEPSYRQCARQMAPRIEAERGAATARMLIEQHVSRIGGARLASPPGGGVPPDAQQRAVARRRAVGRYQSR